MLSRTGDPPAGRVNLVGCGQTSELVRHDGTDGKDEERVPEG